MGSIADETPFVRFPTVGLRRIPLMFVLGTHFPLLETRLLLSRHLFSFLLGFAGFSSGVLA